MSDEQGKIPTSLDLHKIYIPYIHGQKVLKPMCSSRVEISKAFLTFLLTCNQLVTAANNIEYKHVGVLLLQPEFAFIALSATGQPKRNHANTRQQDLHGCAPINLCLCSTSCHPSIMAQDARRLAPSKYHFTYNSSSS